VTEYLIVALLIVLTALTLVAAIDNVNFFGPDEPDPICEECT
jgi:hypothetical protein